MRPHTHTYTHTYIHIHTHIHTHTYIHTHIYIHIYMQMQIILLPLSGHAHLAEPGCLCTKQALGASASKLLENGLGTRRRISYLLTASGVGTQSPTWTTAVERKGAVICTPAYARYPFTAGGCRLDNIHLRVVGLEPMTHGSGAQCTNHFTNQAPHTYIYRYMLHFSCSIPNPTLYLAKNEGDSIHTYIHIHTYMQCKNANFAATRWSRSPGRARMPVH